jgi:hypothetical protein
MLIQFLSAGFVLSSLAATARAHTVETDGAVPARARDADYQV